MDLPHELDGRGASSSSDKQQNPVEGGVPPGQGGIGVRCKTVDLLHWVVGSGASDSIEKEAGSSSVPRTFAKHRVEVGGSSSSTCNTVEPPSKVSKLNAAVKGDFKQLVARVSGVTSERDAKRIKADTTLQFTLHETAIHHSIAAGDSDKELDDHDANSTWWNQVEACIDRDWWSEVEVAMEADDGQMHQDSSKREWSQPCIESDAKRARKPG